MLLASLLLLEEPPPPPSCVAHPRTSRALYALDWLRPRMKEAHALIDQWTARLRHAARAGQAPPLPPRMPVSEVQSLLFAAGDDPIRRDAVAEVARALNGIRDQDYARRATIGAPIAGAVRLADECGLALSVGEFAQFLQQHEAALDELGFALGLAPGAYAAQLCAALNPSSGSLPSVLTEPLLSFDRRRYILTTVGEVGLRLDGAAEGVRGLTLCMGWVAPGWHVLDVGIVRDSAMG